MPLTKRDIANRQLDAAIRMLFAGYDAVAIHTLVGAASTIISDLIEHMSPANSWDRKAQMANGMDAKTFYKVMRSTQNKLKHARTDPNDLVDVDILETLALTFFALMNNGELRGKLSIAQSFFEWWYLASFHKDEAFARIDVGEHFDAFGNLDGLTVTEKIQRGKEVWEREHTS